MATKTQRQNKQARRAHHNTVNRTSVPKTCIAKSQRLTIFDLEGMAVKDLRAMAKENGITGFSKAKPSELIAKLALLEIRKHVDA